MKLLECWFLRTLHKPRARIKKRPIHDMNLSTWSSHSCLHNKLYKAFHMHHLSHAQFLRIPTLHVILAVVLYIVAIKFCSGEATPIRKTCELPSNLTAQNADVAQTFVNTMYFDFMNLFTNWNVLYMLTTGTFAHSENTSTFAFRSLVRL